MSPPPPTYCMAMAAAQSVPSSCVSWTVGEISHWQEHNVGYDSQSNLLPPAEKAERRENAPNAKNSNKRKSLLSPVNENQPLREEIFFCKFQFFLTNKLTTILNDLWKQFEIAVHSWSVLRFFFFHNLFLQRVKWDSNLSHPHEEQVVTKSSRYVIDIVQEAWNISSRTISGVFTKTTGSSTRHCWQCHWSWYLFHGWLCSLCGSLRVQFIVVFS